MAYPDDRNLTSLATLKAWLDPPPQSGITAVAVQDGGSGYTAATVSIVDTTGTGATATATIVGGIIVSINMTNRGRDYSAPSVVITGDGAGAAAAATCGADVALSSLINRASSILLSVANYDVFYDSGSNISETRNGNGQNMIVPNVTPIFSVTGVSINGSPLAPSDGNSVGYRNDDGIIYAIGCRFTKGIQNVSLVYRGGVQPNSQLANDAEQACLSTCAYWWKKRPHLEHMSESPQGIGSTSYSQADIPKDARMIMNQIKRVAVSLFP